MKQYGDRHAILGRRRMNKKYELASSLHSSAIMFATWQDVHVKAPWNKLDGPSLKPGRETVYAAEGLDIHVRRTETIFTFGKTCLK